LGQLQLGHGDITINNNNNFNRTTTNISIVASKAENGRPMRSIAAALLTETGTRLTIRQAALANSRPRS